MVVIVGWVHRKENTMPRTKKEETVKKKGSIKTLNQVPEKKPVVKDVSKTVVPDIASTTESAKHSLSQITIKAESILLSNALTTRPNATALLQGAISRLKATIEIL